MSSIRGDPPKIGRAVRGEHAELELDGHYPAKKQQRNDTDVDGCVRLGKPGRLLKEQYLDKIDGVNEETLEVQWKVEYQGKDDDARESNDEAEGQASPLRHFWRLWAPAWPAPRPASSR